MQLKQDHIFYFTTINYKILMFYSSLFLSILLFALVLLVYENEIDFMVVLVVFLFLNHMNLHFFMLFFVDFYSKSNSI